MMDHKVGTREEWLAARNHTYTRSAPDRDFVVPYYQQPVDRTPKGRVDQFWAARRDEHEHAAR